MMRPREIRRMRREARHVLAAVLHPPLEITQTAWPLEIRLPPSWEPGPAPIDVDLPKGGE